MDKEERNDVPFYVQVNEELKRQEKKTEREETIKPNREQRTKKEEIPKWEEHYDNYERPKRHVQRSKPRQSINVTNVMIIVLSLLLIGTFIYTLTVDIKYKKVIASFSQKDENKYMIKYESKLSNMDERLTKMEDNLSDIEDMLNTVLNNDSGEDVIISTPPSSPSLPSSSSSSSSSSGQYTYYVVQKGDTLWSISQKFYSNGSKYKELMSINGFKNESDLKAGTKILVPKN